MSLLILMLFIQKHKTKKIQTRIFLKTLGKYQQKIAQILEFLVTQVTC